MSVLRKFNFQRHFPLIFVICLAVFLRFFNYSDRIVVSLDQGRDALIGLYSLENHKAPLIGPPSSSWGFNFGPLYYYFIVLFEAVIPHLFAPWIGFTLLSLISVYLAYKIGERTSNKFALFLGLLTAVSFAEIENSSNLLNTSLVSFAVFLSFFSLSQVLSNKIGFSIVMGLAMGLAINSHLQSLPILSLLLVTPFLYSGKIRNKIIVFIFSGFGLLISFIPILIFESQHYFAWTKSLIDYALHGQHKFYTPVRWLTDITQFWPYQTGRVIFGEEKTGYFILLVILIALALSVIKKIRPPKELVASIVVFAFEIFSVRYYKGTRSSEYFVLINFFIIFFTSYAFLVLTKINKTVGNFAFVFFISLSVLFSTRLIVRSSHSSATLVLFDVIKENQKEPVSLQVLPNSHENAYTLYYLLQKSNLTSQHGVPLALCDNHDSLEKGREVCPLMNRLFVSGRFVLYNYSAFNKNDRFLYPVDQVSPERLYFRTYNNYELKKY